MAKIFRKEVAGNLVRACCFTMPLPRDTALERAEKQKMTSAARARMNVKTSWEKCRLTAAANFGAGDLFVSLTYDESSLPAHREEATSKMAGFLRQLRAAYKRADAQELKYLYVTEHKHGEGRWHHHAFISGNSRAGELIRSLWTYGLVDIKPVDPLQLVDLAKYFCKESVDERRKVGKRLWTPSKNLSKPKIERQYVSDDFTLTVPPGGYLIENPSSRNNYGEFSYLEYWQPGSAESAVI